MSAETNKVLFQQFIDRVVSQGDLDLFDELTTPDFVEHEEIPAGFPEGREGVKTYFRMARAAFPDLHATLDDVIAEGDMVVGRSTWTGTHQGEFLGIPATGNRVSFGVIDIVRVVDGKAVEHWGQSDMMTLMQQLGVMPAPGQ